MPVMEKNLQTRRKPPVKKSFSAGWWMNTTALSI
jgi:hypothetical protein